MSDAVEKLSADALETVRLREENAMLRRVSEQQRLELNAYRRCHPELAGLKIEELHESFEKALHKTGVKRGGKKSDSMLAEMVDFIADDVVANNENETGLWAIPGEEDFWLVELVAHECSRAIKSSKAGIVDRLARKRASRKP